MKRGDQQTDCHKNFSAAIIALVSEMAALTRKDDFSPP
jgi:hypothetical protein